MIMKALCALTLPLILTACGGAPSESSSDASKITAGCGNGLGHAAAPQSEPGDTSDWTGAYWGNHYGSSILVDLAANGEKAVLTVDGGAPVDLHIVARLYCSDSIGMFGDGATRAESGILVTLFRTESNERSVQFTRWNK